MQIVPVWNAIETILKADALTKDTIKGYTQQILEAGLNTPICLIGRVVKVLLKEPYLNDAHGARPYSLHSTTTVAILAERPYSGRHKIKIAALDVMQNNITTVLNKAANRTLGGTVSNCIVTGIYDVHADSESGEYVGFELVLEFDKTE